jgi:hypothetical protein
MTTIFQILQKNGPLLSSELARQLHVSNSIPYNTASQRVARDKSIEKIKGFFISSQSLCYLPEHKEDNFLFQRLSEAMFENGKKYWHCLNAIKLHGGIISRKYLECYTNYPVLPLKSHLPFDVVMQNFISQDILIYNEDYYMFSPKFAQTKISSISYRTIELIKDNILSDFNSLTKNIGLISYKTGKPFSEFGKFRWGFKGVSNVTGLMQNDKNGFLLADIIVGAPLYQNDIDFFIQKLKYIQSFKNASKIIPFLLVDNLDKEALLALKKNGIVVGFINELFGQKYADTLQELITILNNAGASLKKSPEQYLNLIKQLKKYNEGLVNNIRGALFEFLIGHIHSINSNSSVDLGREIYENFARHEIDVQATYPDKIIIAECKSQKSEIDIDVIEKWSGKKIPAFKKWFDRQETLKNKKLEFEFWSTSGYTEKALEKLNHLSSTSERYKVTYFTGIDIRNKAMEMNNKKLKEAIDGFFLKPIV